MRIVFLGNHTVGVKILDELIAHSCIDVVGVVAHPDDPEDGVVYESVHDYATRRRIETIRGKTSSKGVYEFIKRLSPDLLWVADYRYILSDNVIALAHRGAINLHPGKLPKYRGRAPINWAILNGERELGLTAHWISSKVDSGDILEQMSFRLSEDEDVGDALKKLYPMYQTTTRKVIDLLISGDVQGVKQEDDETGPYPPRKPEDGRIDWNMHIDDIVNLVRAVSRPYPGAFGCIDDQMIRIWKAKKEISHSQKKPGTVISADLNRIVVAARGGELMVNDYEYGDSSSTIKIEPGMRFDR